MLPDIVDLAHVLKTEESATVLLKVCFPFVSLFMSAVCLQCFCFIECSNAYR